MNILIILCTFNYIRFPLFTYPNNDMMGNYIFVEVFIRFKHSVVLLHSLTLKKKINGLIYRTLYTDAASIHYPTHNSSPDLKCHNACIYIYMYKRSVFSRDQTKQLLCVYSRCLKSSCKWNTHL